MKQKDLAIIIAVAGFSTIVAFVIANLLITSPKNRQTSVPVVDTISSNFSKPDSRYFNSSSIDPSQTVTIGDNNNAQPFKK